MEVKVCLLVLIILNKRYFNIMDFFYHIIELIAALAGTYFYMNTKESKVKIFVWYLWITVFVETFGMYGYILQNNYDNALFIWIKNSPICSNTWLYNTYSFVSIILFGKFFIRIINDKWSKKIIIWSVVLNTLCIIIYFIVSDKFFIISIPYNFLFNTFLIFMFVMLYYRQLLKSDDVLFFYKSPIFYISSGLFLWHLCVAPLVIFNGYLFEINQNFIEFRGFYLFIANTLLYSCYTFGFLYTLQFKKK